MGGKRKEKYSSTPQLQNAILTLALKRVFQFGNSFNPMKYNGEYMFINDNILQKKKIYPSFIERNGVKWEIIPEASRDRFERMEDFPCNPVKMFESFRKKEKTIYGVSKAYRNARWEMIRVRNGKETASTIVDRFEGQKNYYDYIDYIQRGGTENAS